MRRSKNDRRQEVVRVRKLARIPLLLWASPWSVLGLSVGMAAVVTGGRLRVRGPVIEFYGGLISWLFERQAYNMDDRTI